MRPKSFKERLQKILSSQELKEMKTAFDIVGDISILELDEEFMPKATEIAEALLASHKNINTVLNKAGEHEGEFRTQKMQFLAGEDKRLALHKENNTFIYIDVEKVYFSPRLSTERKRIMKLIEPGENILVMFSGAGPYVSVLAKNTKARKITGIEINPEGHKLALLNRKKNKLKNVDLINGDVKEVIPWLIKKPSLALKANWRKDHIEGKLKHKTDFLEIFIEKGDIESRFEEMYKEIKNISKKHDIVLHAPLVYKGKSVNIYAEPENTKELFDIMENICKELNLKGFVAHPYNSNNDMQVDKKKYEKAFINFFAANKYEKIYIENLIFEFFNSVDSIIYLLESTGLRFCLDVAHMFGASENEMQFYDSFERLRKYVDYSHLADARFFCIKRDNLREHTFPVGEGIINFDKIVPFLDDIVIEVKSSDEKEGMEMFESYDKIEKIAQDMSQFDRILMPLPKSAEDFLPIALLAAKPGTRIHFYDFLHEDDFALAEEKAKKACKDAGFKYKKIDFVKCGQHSPRTFRVCLDFMVQ